MKTITRSVGALCLGISLFQCQPTAVDAPQDGAVKTSSANARVAATGLPVSGYTLCYEQNFDSGTQPSASEWIKRTTDRLGGINNAEQVNVGGGTLNINYERRSDGNYYAGGVISTHTFGYGFYEARCNLYRATPGLHQSFWNMGISPGTNPANEGYSQFTQDELPQYGTVLEIDGFEQNSKDGYLRCNHHVYTPSQTSSISQPVVPNPNDDWFTMGFEWRPDGITYYYKLDGGNWTQVATKSLTSSPWNVYAPQNFWLTALPVPNNTYNWGYATPPVAGAAMKVGHFKYYAKKYVGTNLIGNPGFEYKNASTASAEYPIGWIESRTNGNNPDRSYVTTNATNANYGERYLVHESYSTPYNCTTKQKLEYIPYGTYKLTAYVRSSGGQAAARMRVLVGGVERYVNIPATTSWQQITIDNINVNSDDVVVAFSSYTDGPGQWIAVDSVQMIAK
jgi:hypothetical protein